MTGKYNTLMVRLLILAFVTIPLAAADFTIAGIRVIPDAWDKDANLARIERFTREAAAKGANVVVTPEGFLEGYVGNIKKHPSLTREKYARIGETIDGNHLSPALEKLRLLAAELKIYLIACFALREQDRMFNSLAIFSPQGEVAMRYEKAHNADDEPFNTRGVKFPTVDTPLGRWGTLICYDRQLPETSRILAIKGAQLIIVPAWGGYSEMNDAMMRTRAFENSVWVAFVHPQRFLLIDPRGTIVASDDGGKGDQVVMGKVKFDHRIGDGAIRSRQPEIYGELLKPR